MKTLTYMLLTSMVAYSQAQTFLRSDTGSIDEQFADFCAKYGKSYAE